MTKVKMCFVISCNEVFEKMEVFFFLDGAGDSPGVLISLKEFNLHADKNRPSNICPQTVGYGSLLMRLLL